MVKDGKDGHGLQTTNLKNVGWTFQDAHTVRCGSFNKASECSNIELILVLRKVFRISSKLTRFCGFKDCLQIVKNLK